MPIHCETEGDHLLVITIDRPERKNAMDLHHFRDLARAWRDFRDDDDLWVAIVTGTDGCFMVGRRPASDYVPQITALSEQIAAGEVDEIDGCRLSDGTEAVLRNVKLYKPIIAAIDGPCVAGGMEMLGGIDIRVATPARHLRGDGAQAGPVRRRRHHGPPAPPGAVRGGDGVPAHRRGVPGAAGPRAGPAQRDRRARRADGHAPATGPGRILANGPLAVRATKESVVRGMSGTLRDAYKIESEISGIVFQSERRQGRAEGLRREARPRTGRTR